MKFVRKVKNVLPCK